MALRGEETNQNNEIAKGCWIKETWLLTSETLDFTGKDYEDTVEVITNDANHCLS